MFTKSKFYGIGSYLFLIFSELGGDCNSTVTHVIYSKASWSTQLGWLTRTIPERLNFVLQSPELPKCNSFVFFDIEATGVPHMEKKGKARITEISLIAVSRDEFYKEYKGLPRVLPKLTILSNPERKISYITSRLTGEDNRKLFQNFILVLAIS